MYFLYVLQQKDYPVFEIFEQDIKTLDTFRFSKELDEEYKSFYLKMQKKKFLRSRYKSKYIKSFRAERYEKLIDQYENQTVDESSQSNIPLEFGEPRHKQKPKNIPNLKLNNINEEKREYYDKDLIKNSNDKNPSSIKRNHTFDWNSFTNSIEEWDCSDCLKKIEIVKIMDSLQRMKIFKNLLQKF